MKFCAILRRRSQAPPEPDNKDQPLKSHQGRRRAAGASAGAGGRSAQRRADREGHPSSATAWPARQRLALNSDPGKVTQVIQASCATSIPDRPVASRRAGSSSSATAAEGVADGKASAMSQIQGGNQGRPVNQGLRPPPAALPERRRRRPISRSRSRKRPRSGQDQPAPATPSPKAPARRSSRSTASTSRTTTRASR